MKKINIILLVVIIHPLIGCNNQSKNGLYADSEKIYNLAIDIHDEVMPLMGDIMKLQSTLKAKKDEISDEGNIEKIDTVLQRLENAHNSMMLWMKQVTPIPEISDNNSDLSGFPSEKEMLDIQKRSLENVKKVKEAILSSIEEANALISEL
jgi:hypothetical protein